MIGVSHVDGDGTAGLPDATHEVRIDLGHDVALKEVRPLPFQQKKTSLDGTQADQAVFVEQAFAQLAAHQVLADGHEQDQNTEGQIVFLEGRVYRNKTK